MIVITGAAGFIGSCLVSKLNEQGIYDLVLVDEFSSEKKALNFASKKYHLQVNRNDFFIWLEKNHEEVAFIYHLGARTDTTEFNKMVFDELNLNYSKAVWKLCTQFSIPLVYASSAATYGLGEFGYLDSHELVEKLKPLNPYGESKNDFDIWALNQTTSPPFWAGLKFFNVYGPNEYHKGRMASVIFHAFYQIKEKETMKLFKSHNPNYKDGGQLRDFVYVKDVVSVCSFFLKNRQQSGIFNLGSGKARNFLDLARATFKTLNTSERIEFIDTPIDIREKYQYFTEAKMEKIRKAGYQNAFYTLEEGVADYILNYLNKNAYY